MPVYTFRHLCTHQPRVTGLLLLELKALLVISPLLLIVRAPEAPTTLPVLV